MNFIDYILLSVKYVMSANLFWPSMGFTASIAVFVGAIIYDGVISDAKKGIFSVITYAGMLVWTTTSRILPVYFKDDFVSKEVSQQVFASPITIVFVSLSWSIGVCIGVFVIHQIHNGRTK